MVAAASAIALSRRANRGRELLVDVSVLSEFDAKSGIQRVTRAIAMQLLTSPPDGWRVRLVRIDRSAMAYRYADTYAQSLGFVAGEPGAENEWLETANGDCFLGLDLTADTVPLAHGWFAAQHRRGVALYFVVYDLLPVLRPEWFSEGIARCFPAWIDCIGELADGLIGISMDVVAQLQKHYAERPPQRYAPLTFKHFHLGADLPASVPTFGLAEDANVVLETMRKRPSFLMVGTVEPRKGYVQALEAFSLLWQQGVDVNLVIVGKAGWHQDAVKKSLLEHPEAGQRLLWLQGISDEYLEAIYAASTCLLAASEGEGFGLPLVEAAQKGLPVLARDLPVFREVAEEHATYFHGTEAIVLADAVSNWLSNFRHGSVPSSAGMRWLTWRDSADQLVDALFGQDRSLHKVDPVAAGN
jgi:glycosyltransferase involved in cell wall biosynthesis